MSEYVWILVFMFHGVPMASGPHSIEACIEMAGTQTRISGIKAHCYKPGVPFERRWP